MALFTAASLVRVLADSLTALTLARMLQGLGAAGIMSVNTALVRLDYLARLLGRGIALNSMVVATASVAGPSLAAGILPTALWPWLFALNLPLGLVRLWLGLKALPGNLAKASGARFSLLDVALNGLMFALVLMGIDGLGGASSPALAAGLVVGYVRHQLGEPVPLFPLDLLRIPVFALSMGTSVGPLAPRRWRMWACLFSC
jgi:DHA2 family multidrug resistance protein-like MFS transporter